MNRLAPLLLLLAIWLVPGPVLADEGPLAQALATARQALAAGQAVRADAALEAAYRAGARNPALCLAGASTAAQAGDKARATVWLLRAHFLDPADPQARQALAALDATLPGFRPPLATRLAPRPLVWLALAGNGLFWLLLALARSRHWRPAGRLALLSGLVAGWLWIEAGAALVGPWLWPVGVVRRDLAAASAPEPGAEPLFPLTAGQVVALGPTRDGSIRITAGPDRLAWLADSDMIRAAP